MNKDRNRERGERRRVYACKLPEYLEDKVDYEVNTSNEMRC